MKYIAKERLPQTRSTTYDVKISLTRRGLPRIIPVYFRERINQKCVEDVKTVLTIFGLYRVLPYPGKVNLKTITDPGNGNCPYQLQDFIPIFWKILNLHKDPRIPLKPDFKFNPFVISKKGSFFSNLIRPKKVKEVKKMFKREFTRIYSIPLWTKGNSSSGFISALIHLFMNKDLGKSISWFLTVSFPKRYRGITPLSILEEFMDKLVVFFHASHLRFGKTACGGSLAFLQEPGKVRVVAMVDCMTQWVLRPLHDWIFLILKHIETEYGTDATFNQDEGVLRLQKLLKKSQRAYSFDLSSATDRLPLGIQVDILNFVDKDLGDHGSNLLVNRSYSVPKGEAIRYATGQPMGALSSGGMLALTHHLIIQYCAYQVYKKKTGFRQYLILGDDIVILNKRVADEYLLTMKMLDVGINLAKSLVSKIGFAEFAKRFISGESDFSAVSLKEFQSLHLNGSSILMLTSKFKISSYKFLRFLGYGTKASGQLLWSGSHDGSHKRGFGEAGYLIRYGKGNSFQPFFHRFFLYFFNGISSEIDKGVLYLKEMELARPAIFQWAKGYKISKFTDLEFIRSRLFSGKIFDELILPYSLAGVPRILKAQKFDRSLLPLNVNLDPFTSVMKSLDLIKTLEFIQVFLIKLFRGSSFGYRLVHNIHPGFVKDFKAWKNDGQSFHRFDYFFYQHIRFVYGSEFYKDRDITYNEKYIQTRRNKRVDEILLLEKMFTLMRQNPGKFSAKAQENSGDPGQLEEIFGSPIIRIDDELKLRNLAEFSKLLALKSKFGFDWHHRHSVKLITHSNTYIREACYLSSKKKVTQV